MKSLQFNWQTFIFLIKFTVAAVWMCDFDCLKHLVRAQLVFLRVLSVRIMRGGSTDNIWRGALSVSLDVLLQIEGCLFRHF